MKSKFRSQVAALMLFAPLASPFVAGPAHAQERAAPQIQTMTLNGNDGLAAGSRLRIMVQGSPGGQATVNFGKTDIEVPLAEAERGVYRGTYVVRASDRIDPTSVMNVRLSRGGEVARHSFTYPPSFQAHAAGSQAAIAAAPPPSAPPIVTYEREADRTPPTIANLTPQNGDILAPHRPVLISGQFDDANGRGVNPDSVRLTVDGRDMTTRADISPESFSLRTDLPPGNYRAEISARDRAGNWVRRSWGFSVGHQRG